MRFVRTTIHLAPSLLAAVDRRAQELRISRNRYIREALERSLRADREWSPTLVRKLRTAGRDPEDQRVLTEMLQAIRANRRSKGPPPIQ